MKTLRIALISLVAAASGAATFAGPGPQYWAARRAEQVAKKADSTPAAASKEKAGACCDTAKCKAACCS